MFIDLSQDSLRFDCCCPTSTFQIKNMAMRTVSGQYLEFAPVRLRALKHDSDTVQP